MKDRQYSREVAKIFAEESRYSGEVAEIFAEEAKKGAQLNVTRMEDITTGALNRKIGNITPPRKPGLDVYDQTTSPTRALITTALGLDHEIDDQLRNPQDS